MPKTGGTAPTGNVIKSNWIGTNLTGTAAIANTNGGILINGARSTMIGGLGSNIPTDRNIISGNGGNGIALFNGATLNRISGNYIGTAANGTTALGNAANGIFLGTAVSGSIIGGTEANSGNTIAYNGQNGVALASDAGNNNLIDPNSIFGNTLRGVDIGGDGFTPNDPTDADVGPNNLQNHPELVSKFVVNNELRLSFKVDSAPEHSAYGTSGIYVEFFKADATGAGERFLGFGYYSIADYNNGTPLAKTINLGSVTTLGIQPGDMITATATDANGNSSEFTPPLAPSAAAVKIGGRILKSGGIGVANAKIVITNAGGQKRTALSNSFGWYQFEDIAAGQTYVVTVSHKQYQFDPPKRTLSVMDELADVNFTVIP